MFYSALNNKIEEMCRALKICEKKNNETKFDQKYIIEK